MIVFKDDFETGAFLGDKLEKNGQATIESIIPHNGNYGARFITQNLTGYLNACEVASVAPVNQAYAEGLFYLPSLPAMPQAGDMPDRVFFIIMSTLAESVAYAGIVRTSSGIQWMLMCRNGEEWVNVAVGTPQAGRTYKVGLLWIGDAANGGVQLYIDDVLTNEISGQNTSALGSCERIFMGIAEKAGTAYSVEVYGDDFLVADKIPQIFELTISSTPGGTTNPSGKQYYYADETAVVQALPEAGATFYWELDGFAVGMDNPYNLIMNANHILRAVFTIPTIKHQLTIMSTPPAVPFDLSVEAITKKLNRLIKSIYYIRGF